MNRFLANAHIGFVFPWVPPRSVRADRADPVIGTWTLMSKIEVSRRHGA